ncbi:hypothetical protein QBC46DRAFT_437991 [Diplogelasinospora grovesii]|uniref:F-box domain-containing protein n=1 Tax=Diplogelasinospora grovesii TaxID=303347 RepID=A0AAN6S464_9PEZI|nr:hypothetical protein QBC46DRAFT_437991 [Diplogelasinospora grovesii]
MDLPPPDSTTELDHKVIPLVEHKTTPPLLRCPVDIVNLILGFLAQSDLGAAGLVNKALLTLAEPFLYSEIRVSWPLCVDHPPIFRLLRNIARRPHLALYIRSFTVDGEITGRPYCGRSNCQYLQDNRRSSRGERRYFDRPEIEEIIAFAKRLELPGPDRDTWTKALKHGSRDALIAVLLSRLVNLRSLKLAEGVAKNSRFIGMILRSALCEPASSHGLPTFEHVCDVSFNLTINNPKHSTQADLNIPTVLRADVLPFFYLPGIQSLSLTIDDLHADFQWPASIPPVPKTLTSLELTCPKGQYLGPILAVTKGLLKSLHWIWHYRRYHQEDVHVVNLNEIGAAIHQLSDTLTDLAISAKDGYPIGGNPFPPVSRGSLRELGYCDHLTRLMVPFIFLVGWPIHTDAAAQIKQILPKSLEYLTITDGTLNYGNSQVEELQLAAMRPWLENWQAYTPRLRLFWLLFRVVRQRWLRPMQTRLELLCTQVGLPVRISYF